MSRPLVILVARDYEHKGETRTAFTRIGRAFKTEQGNLRLLFDAHPIDREAIIMPEKEREEQQSSKKRTDDDDIPF